MAKTKGSWTCEECRRRNSRGAAFCGGCGHVRFEDRDEPDWICGYCKARNEGHVGVCARCGATRDDASTTLAREAPARREASSTRYEVEVTEGRDEPSPAPEADTGSLAGFLKTFGGFALGCHLFFAFTCFTCTFWSRSCNRELRRRSASTPSTYVSTPGEAHRRNATVDTLRWITVLESTRSVSTPHEGFHEDVPSNAENVRELSERPHHEEQERTGIRIERQIDDETGAREVPVFRTVTRTAIWYSWTVPEPVVERLERSGTDSLPTWPEEAELLGGRERAPDEAFRRDGRVLIGYGLDEGLPQERSFPLDVLHSIRLGGPLVLVSEDGFRTTSIQLRDGGVFPEIR